MHTNIHVVSLSCRAPFCTALSGDYTKNRKKSLRATVAFLKLATGPFAVSLTSKETLYEKYKAPDERIGEISQHKGDVPSLGWNSLWLCRALWMDTFIITTKQVAPMCTQGTAHLPPMFLCHACADGTSPFQGDLPLTGCGHSIH